MNIFNARNQSDYVYILFLAWPSISLAYRKELTHKNKEEREILMILNFFTKLSLLWYKVTIIGQQMSAELTTLCRSTKTVA